MKKISFPLTPFYVRLVYGIALERAGVPAADRIIDELLDDGRQETFKDYFPSGDAFAEFEKRFSWTRHAAPVRAGWDNYDQEKMNTPPEHKQSIKNYFLEVFKPSII